jgi:two-component system, NarL family, nitrate/nitrite response regulator NarL
MARASVRRFLAGTSFPMRTLIVDDHPLFSEGLRLLLSANMALQDISCCDSGEKALALAAQTRFELVLLDWNLGASLSGVALVQQLKAQLPLGRVVIVSGECNSPLVCLAIDSGAVGFVPKESSPALLIEALALTTRGGIYLPQVLLARSDAQHGAAAEKLPTLRSIADTFTQLTPRQVEVLNCLVHGLSNKQVARELGISDGTVKQHLNTVFRELNVQNRTEVVYLLAKRGVQFD